MGIPAYLGAKLKRWFRQFILSLPAPLRYLLSLVAFWPTVVINRAYCLLWPHKRRLWDRVSEHIVLGAAPLWPSEVYALYHQEGVRAVVNMCKEWDWHSDLYAMMGIRQLRLPTVSVAEICSRAAGRSWRRT
jgi:hypothetical protein